MAALDTTQMGEADKVTLATAVRFSAEQFCLQFPGRAVELRIPTVGAWQCMSGGTHTRGTPRAVVELGPEVWLKLVHGQASWDEIERAGVVHASGLRSDLGQPLASFVQWLHMMRQ